MNTKEFREIKQGLALTSRQRDIIVGTLLGDAHLETQNDGKTYRLKIEHSIDQMEYVEWLYHEFQEWVPGKIYVRRRKDGRTFTGFTTYSHGAFRFYAHQFYDGRKKSVPKNIHKTLKPLGIAVWYMDDGSQKSAKHNTYIIHTYGFTKSGLERLQEVLSQHKIETTLHRQKRNTLRIYVLTKSSMVFYEMLKKHVGHIRTMQYKIGLTRMPKE